MTELEKARESAWARLQSARLTKEQMLDEVANAQECLRAWSAAVRDAERAYDLAADAAMPTAQGGDHDSA